MKTLKSFVIGLALLATASTALAQRGEDGTVNLLYWQAISIINPYLSGGTKDIYASSIVLEPLVRYDVDGNYVPWLATELPTVENGGVAEDFTSITWNIQPGVLWSDGTPLTSRDFEFTWQYCTSGGGCVAEDFFADIESFDLTSDTQFTINFSRPKPVPYSAFVGAEAPVLQAAQFADCLGENMQTCTEQNFYPVGTGPYVVTDMRPNDVVTYAINEHYRDPAKPAFSEVVIKGGGDAASAARAVMETGEADWAWNLQVDPVVLAQMEAAGIGQLTTSFGTSMERVMFQWTNVDPSLGDDRGELLDGNNPHPFLTETAVRQAMAMAIDQEILVEVGYGPTGRVTCNLVPAPAMYASTANDGCDVQDIEGANALLDEAGWVRGPDGIRAKDGVRLSVLYSTSTNAVRQDFQALIQEWWNEIGIEVELRNVDAGVFFGNDPSSPDTYGKFWTDVQMYTSSASGTDIPAYISAYLCSQASQRENNWLGSNNTRYCNPEFDELHAELAVTADLDQRAEIIKRLNDIVVQDYVVVPLVYRGDVSARANSLMGTAKNSWDSELWNIADWYRAD